MLEIDEGLVRLSAEPAPPELASLESQVLARVAGYSHAPPGASFRTRAALIGIALMVGIAGGLVPETSANAHHSYAPLTEMDMLAPSTLLADS